MSPLDTICCPDAKRGPDAISRDWSGQCGTVMRPRAHQRRGSCPGDGSTRRLHQRRQPPASTSWRPRRGTWSSVSVPGCPAGSASSGLRGWTRRTTTLTLSISTPPSREASCSSSATVSTSSMSATACSSRAWTMRGGSGPTDAPPASCYWARPARRDAPRSTASAVKLTARHASGVADGDSTGGTANAGGAPTSSISRGPTASESRRVSDGRFHTSSTSRSTEVWSNAVSLTAPGEAKGETITAGIRKPKRSKVRKPSSTRCSFWTSDNGSLAMSGWRSTRVAARTSSGAVADGGTTWS